MNYLTKNILVISVAIIALVGIAPTLWFDDWQWLSRSGSLLTAYGIYLAFKELIEDIRPNKEYVEFIEKLANKPSEELTRDERLQKAVLVPGKLTHLLQKSDWESRTRLADAIEPSVKLAELYLLIVGTIIWGYGDVPNQIRSYFE